MWAARTRIPLAAMVLFALLSSAIALAAQGQQALVILEPSGVVRVELHAWLTRGPNEIRLPVTPIPSTIIVSINNTLLPPIYVNNTLYVFSPVNGNATIDYVANVSVKDGIYTLLVSGNAVLVVPPRVVLLTLPNVTKVAEKDGNLLFYIKGVNLIRYTILAPSQTPTATSKTPTRTATTLTRTTPTPIGTSTQTPSPTLSSTTRRKGGGLNPLLPGIIVAVLAIVVAALLAARRRPGGAAASQAPPTAPGNQPPGGQSTTPRLEVELSDTDKLVLAKLRELGGKALQSELIRATGLPKTTLWRAVRRLEKLGLVKVYKDSQGRNVVVLSM